jgi:hypothetical protein
VTRGTRILLLAILLVIVVVVGLVLLGVLPGAIIWVVVGAVVLGPVISLSKGRSSTGPRDQDTVN